MPMHGAKNSDRQIYVLPIPTESQFGKFNACQTFLLFSTIKNSLTVLDSSNKPEHRQKKKKLWRLHDFL